MGELAKHGMLLRSKRATRRRRKSVGERQGAPITIDDRPESESASDRRVPGSWESDLVIGAGGQPAAITFAERHCLYVVIPGLPLGKDSAGVADELIEHDTDLPAHLRGSRT